MTKCNKNKCNVSTTYDCVYPKPTSREFCFSAVCMAIAVVLTSCIFYGSNLGNWGGIVLYTVSTVSMFLVIAVMSMTANVYANLFKTYFAMATLVLFTAFLSFGEFKLALASLVVMGLFYKGLDYGFNKLQAYVAGFKLRGKQ